MKRYTAIILAAGSGQRLNLGYNKIFFELYGTPIIALSAKHFFQDNNCKQIIYVGKMDELNHLKQIMTHHQLHDERCLYVSGGPERQYSVYNGLQHANEEIVFIHDGARPFLTEKLLVDLYDQAKRTGAAVPGYPVKDTIKVVNDNVVSHTLDRSTLYHVQTPQVVQTKHIKEAHQLARKDQLLLTDDVSLIEHYQLAQVSVVEASPENMKVTTPMDLLLANELYKKYFGGGNHS